MGFVKDARKLPRVFAPAVHLLLLAAMQSSLEATTPWIEIRQHPPLPPQGVIAGQVIAPSAQPLVALWNHRGSEDIFGQYIPPQVVYDTQILGVLVNVTLRAEGSGETREMLGESVLTTKCGKAQFTNLQIQKAGRYFLSFSATYLSSHETVNSTKVFEVAHGPPHRLVLIQEPRGFWMKRPFQTQPIVEIYDKGDNLVKNAELPVTVQLITSSENAIRNDVKELKAVAGVARFASLPCKQCLEGKTGIAVDVQGWNMKIKFSTVVGVESVESGFFSVGSWPPYSMALSNYPPAPVGGLVFDKQPELTLLDIDGILATWDPGERLYVDAKLFGRASFIPTNLQGRTSVEVVSGKAIFTDLRHDFMATDYYMSFSLNASAITTVQDLFPKPFDVINGIAFQLSMGESYGHPALNGTQPGGFRSGFAMLTQPVVLVLDSVGNMLWQTAINVTAQLFAIENGTVKEIYDHGFLHNSTHSVISCPLFKGRHDCSKCKATTRIPATCGTAPFTDLRIDTSYMDLILRFSSPSLRSIDSLPFRVPAGEMHSLFLRQEPFGFKYDTPLRIQPSILIKDRGNNTIPVNGTHFVTAQLCSQNSTRLGTCFPNSSIATQASIVNGIAQFTDMKTQVVGTNFTIRFCSSPAGLQCVNSAAFEVTEDPTRLLVNTQPTNSIPGLVMPVAPIVQVSDSLSARVTWEPSFGFKINCTLCELISGVNSTADEWKCAPDERWLELNTLDTCHYTTPDQLQNTLLGTSSQHVVEGLAVFSDIRIDRKGTYKLKFTCGGLISVESRRFSVALGKPVSLKILVNASEALPGLPLKTQPIVAVVDAGGNNIEADHNTRINATLWSGDGMHNLGLVPTHFIAPSHAIGYHNATALTRFGVAVFEGLRIDSVGSYVIRYYSDLYTSANQSLQVHVGLGMRLNITLRPTGCCSYAACNFKVTDAPECRTVPVLSILDLGGNVVPWNGVRVNATVFARSIIGRRDIHSLSQNSMLPKVADDYSVRMKSFFATSDGRGTITFTDFAMDTPGNYTVRFRSISPYVWRTRHLNGSWTEKYFWSFLPAEVRFSVSGRLSKLALVKNPSEIIPGSPIVNQPVVKLLDAHGYIVDHDWSSLITVSLSDSKGASIMVGGKKILTATPPVNADHLDSGGHVYFTDLRIDLVRRCIRIRFSTFSHEGKVIELASNPFNIELGPFHRIQVSRQPNDATIGKPFGIQPHVTLTDFGGNIVEDDSKTRVTASVFRGTIGDLKSDAGKQIVTMSQGKAQFEDLKTNIAAECLQLEMLAIGREPGYSIPFEIPPDKPYRIAFLDDEATDRTPIQFAPSGPRPGLPLVNQPMIKVEDIHGNRIGRSGGLFGEVTANLMEGGKPAECSYPIKHCLKGKTVVQYDEFDGIARFTDLRIDRMNTFGNYSILFTSVDLETVQSHSVGNVSKIFWSLLPLESSRAMTVIPGSMTVGLEAVVEPDKFIPGTQMKVAPVIGVVDAGGNVVSSAIPTTITVKIQGSNQTLELLGDPVILAFNGLGTFKGLGVKTKARRAILSFDARVQLGSGGFVHSYPFDVSGPLSRLELVSQTRFCTAGEVFAIHAVLKGFDEDELLVTTFGHPPFPRETPDIITVAINETTAFCRVIFINETTFIMGDLLLNDTDNSTIDNRVNTTVNTTTICFNDTRLQGTKQSNYSYGSAEFTDLRIDFVGTYYLRFAVPVLNISILSQPIIISNAKASELILTVQVQGPKEATLPLQRAPEVILKDRFGNLVVDKAFTVNATFFQAVKVVPQQYVQGSLQVNMSEGSATFNNSALGLSLAGNDFNIRLCVQGLPCLFTESFDVPVGKPYKLRVLSSPTRFFVKEPFGDEIAFELLDRGNNLVASSENITISLWNMHGCDNCAKATNISSQGNLTTIETETKCSAMKSQEVFAREYDSMRLPCGQRVSGLYIVQPFCLAEYLNDTIASFCHDVLQDNETSGSLHRNNKEGNYPTTWSLLTSLEMSISSYLVNSSFDTTFVNTTWNTTTNKTENQTYVVSTPNNSTTFLQVNLKYNIRLESNGTVVLGSCHGNVGGLLPTLYNTTNTEEGWETVGKFELRQMLLVSNMTVSNLTMRAIPTISVHNCKKYNFTGNLVGGRGSFSRLTLMSPSNATEDLKLRATFRDREYKPFYSVSTHHLDPGYRLYRQDLVPPVTTSQMSTPLPAEEDMHQIANFSNTSNVTYFNVSNVSNNANLTSMSNLTNNTRISKVFEKSRIFSLDFSKYHIFVETQNFQVSGPPVALYPLTLPSPSTTGGTPFRVQPSFKVVDSGGRLVTKTLHINVTATLLAAGIKGECTVARPFQCPQPTNICALSSSFCPKLLGATKLNTHLGFVSFTDLAITTCNDPRVPYDICVFGEFRLQFNATSIGQTLIYESGFMTTPEDVLLHNVVSGSISNFIGPPAQLFMGIEPLGGSRAGQLIVRQPSIITQDAGGNRIITTPVKLTAVLTVFNRSTNLADYHGDGIQGTRTAIATDDGTFKWTNLKIDRAGDHFVLNFVQLDEVPGFPKAPPVTSSVFKIEAGVGVQLTIIGPPGRGVGGEPFLDQPRLSVLDVRDNIVRFEVHNVSVRLTDDSLKYGGILSVARMLDGSPLSDNHPERFTASTIDGVVQFFGLTIDLATTCYQLNFSAPGLQGAISAPFDILPGKVRKLVIKRQPAGAAPGQVLKIQPLIHLSDFGNNPVRYLRDQVQITLLPGNLSANNSQPLKLFGNNLLRTTDGIVEFTDLMIYHAGVGFKLLASRFVGGMAPIVSSTLDIEVGKPYRLRILTQPAGAIPGHFLTVQPIVQVEDSGSNRVDTTDSVLITAQLFQKGVMSVVALRGPDCSAYECAGQLSDTYLQEQVQITLLRGNCQSPNMTANNVTVNNVTAWKLDCNNVTANHTSNFTSNNSQLLRRTTDGIIDVFGAIRNFCPTCVTVKNPSAYDHVLTVASVQGVAQFTALAIAKQGTGFTIRFVSNSITLSAESQPLSVEAGVPVRLQFERAPRGYLVDTPFRVQPVIQLTDKGGNVVTNRPGVIIATLENPQGAKLLPEGNTRVALLTGRALFLKLKVNQTGQNFKLIFYGNMCTNVTTGATQSPCTIVRSLPFNVTGPRTHVENKVQVETSLVDQLLKPQPEVHLLDAANRTVSWDSGRLLITVEIDPITNTKNSTLSGTLRVPCCEGICAFTDLMINKALAGYRLRFSGPPLVRLVSPLFDVVGPRYLRVSRQPVAYTTGDPLVVQPHVQVLDIYRKAIPGYWLTVSVKIRGNSGALGGFLTGTTSLYTNESTVEFTDLSLTGYGSGYVLEFSCLWFEPVGTQPFDVDQEAGPNVCTKGSVCAAP